MTRRRETWSQVARTTLVLLAHLPVVFLLGWYYERARTGIEAVLEASWNCPC